MTLWLILIRTVAVNHRGGRSVLHFAATRTPYGVNHDLHMRRDSATFS